MIILKKIFLFFVCCFFSGFVLVVNAAQVANVEYVHDIVKEKWEIEVPYAPENSKSVANVEYLLKVIDKTNELLSDGRNTTYYALDEKYATKQAVDVVAVQNAIKKLIVYPSDFYVITTSNTKKFSFNMSAAGDFVVDWGDGNLEKISKLNTLNEEYVHNYDNPGEYKIGFSGTVSSYSEDSFMASISFYGNENIAGIAGSLGKIFGTLGDGTQPVFTYTFSNCVNLKSTIPDDLFLGVYGEPVEWMFFSTFSDSGNITGQIPEDLFSGIVGRPAPNMFNSTFQNCYGLTGPIPVGLFRGISGQPAENMFYGTFAFCEGLTSIPLGLFGDLTNIPASGMFNNTFIFCSGLTGDSAKTKDGIFLYDYFGSVGGEYMYLEATGLNDYDNIPYEWK